MARPTKQGIDYFPLDVNFDYDDKFQMILAKHGAAGCYIIIVVLSKIYSEGYYYKWTEKEQLLTSRRVNSELIMVNSVITDAIEYEIFDKGKFERFSILTSNGIQKRFFEATKKRKNAEIIDDYIINSERTPVNSEKTMVNAEFSTQSKVKERRVKEIKEEERIYPPMPEVTHRFSDNITTLMIKTFGRNPTFPEQELIQHDFLEKFGYETTYKLFKEASLRGFKKLITLRDSIEIINNKPHIKERENERNNQRPNGRTQDNPGRDDPGERELLERLKNRPYKSNSERLTGEV